jgi:hypothetical protein
VLSAAVFSTLEAPDTKRILSDSDIVALSERDLLELKDWIASLRLEVSETIAPEPTRLASDIVKVSAIALATVNAACSAID